MLDPISYWANTSGFGSTMKDAMNPYQNFSSGVARGYGSNFGGSSFGGGGFGSSGGFQPSTSATRSMMADFMADQQHETDMAANALNAITNIKLAGIQPVPQAGGGGGAPQQRKPSTSDRLWGLGTTVAGAAVTAGVGALI